MSRFRRGLGHAVGCSLAVLGGIVAAGCGSGAVTCDDEDTCSASAATEEASTPLGSALQVESNCGGRSAVYCITVHLRDGAKLKPFLASEPLTGGAAACRGWANVFAEKTVAQFSQSDVTYDSYSLKNASAILSGSFSDDNGSPAFPQKVKGWIATYGYECNASGGAHDLRILWIRNSQGRAFIEPFNVAKFNDPASAPEAIVGLAPTFNKSATSNRGRNFVGLTNPYNGGYGTVVFVVAREGANLGITSSTAVNILKSKGCTDEQILQLDGSSVAQLSTNTDGVWSHLVQHSRNMPQVFGLFLP